MRFPENTHHVDDGQDTENIGEQPISVPPAEAMKDLVEKARVITILPNTVILENIRNQE